MRVEVLATAEAELAEAVCWYDGQSEGLGDQFAAEVKQTISRIVRFPGAWPAVSARVRRCRTRRFPYALLYQVRPDSILVLAVMHLHRHPDAWRSRRPPGK